MVGRTACTGSRTHGKHLEEQFLLRQRRLLPRGVVHVVTFRRQVVQVAAEQHLLPVRVLPKQRNINCKPIRPNVFAFLFETRAHLQLSLLGAQVAQRQLKFQDVNRRSWQCWREPGSFARNHPAKIQIHSTWSVKDEARS